MSTSSTPETAKPVEQDPPSDSNTSNTSPESLKIMAEQNIKEQTSTMMNENNGSAEPQASPLNVPTETKDSSIATNNTDESKLVSTENTEGNAKPDSNMPEVNKTDIDLETTVKDVEEPKKEVQEASQKNASESNTAETIKEPTTSNEKNETVEPEAEKKHEDAKETKNPAVDNENPPVINGNEQESANVQDNEESSDCVNIQELTEHVMNILNDEEVVENVMSEQQLLKKNIDLQQFIVKLIHLLKEKTDLCANLDRQNTALISQAKSLKDVIAITKDLLGIRNMEIEHLHADMAAMEESIKEERNRNNLAVQRLNEAMTLNDKLKTEYLTQMDLFQKLREKYNEKVVYLTKENQRLNGLVNNDTQAAEANANEVNDQSNQVESVDK